MCFIWLAFHFLLNGKKSHNRQSSQIAHDQSGCCFRTCLASSFSSTPWHVASLHQSWETRSPETLYGPSGSFVTYFGGSQTWQMDKLKHHNRHTKIMLVASYRPITCMWGPKCNFHLMIAGEFQTGYQDGSTLHHQEPYALSINAAPARWYVVGRAWSNEGGVQTSGLFDSDWLLSIRVLQLDACETILFHDDWMVFWMVQTNMFSQESYNIDVADAAQGLLILTDVIWWCDYLF